MNDVSDDRQIVFQLKFFSILPNTKEIIKNNDCMTSRYTKSDELNILIISFTEKASDFCQFLIKKYNIKNKIPTSISLAIAASGVKL